MSIVKLWLLLLLASTLHVFAQDLSKSVKFDEFEMIPQTRSNLVIDRGNRFAQYIRRKPSNAKLVIIYYNPRQSTFPANKGSESADYTKGILVNGYEISSERILLINGGFREYAALEYWIVEEGGGFPKPTPTLGLNDTIICPEINVASDGFRHNRKEPLKFSVSVNGNDPSRDLGFKWSVSSGKITKGQGTRALEIDLTENNVSRVSASIQLDGLAPDCNNYGSASTQVGEFPYLYAEIQYNYSYLAALIDGLYLSINDDTSLRGHLIFYGPRVGTRREVATRMAEAKKYLSFRRFDTSRITFVHGGYREVNSVVLYIVPDGVADPTPTPTVNEKFVTFTDRIKTRQRK